MRTAALSMLLMGMILASCSKSGNPQAPAAAQATPAPAATQAAPQPPANNPPAAPAQTPAAPAETPAVNPSPTPAPAAAAPAPAAAGGKVASQSVSADDLKRLGLELYGMAVPEKMRRYVLGSTEEIEFWFPESDPAVGKQAGLKKTFTTTPGQAYRLSVEIYDGYQETKYPNHVVQKVTVAGDTVDTHDISVPPFFGWRTVEQTITAKGPSTEVDVFLEVAGPLEHFNWGYSCRAIMRNLKLDQQ